MSKRGSPAFQVTQALNKLFSPGESRHAGKARGQAKHRIFSISTMRTYTEDCTRFAKWARETYGVRDIRKITPDMARAYVDELAARERSGGYLGRVASAIKKLAYALHGEEWDLGRGYHSDRRADRAYAPGQPARIERDMRASARYKQTADVVKLQRIAGLRVDEAVHLRGDEIDVDGCKLHLVKDTKGGRPRTVAVDPKHREYLAGLKRRAESRGDGRVFHDRGGLARATDNALRAACKRLGIVCMGTHGFRRTWAREQLAAHKARGLDEHAARLALAHDLGHGRVAVTYSYVPRGA
jgi:integrase